MKEGMRMEGKPNLKQDVINIQALLQLIYDNRDVDSENLVYEVNTVKSDLYCLIQKEESLFESMSVSQQESKKGERICANIDVLNTSMHVLNQAYKKDIFESLKEARNQLESIQSD